MRKKKHLGTDGWFLIKTRFKFECHRFHEMSFCCHLPASQILILQQEGSGGYLGPSKESSAQLVYLLPALQPTCSGMSSSSQPGPLLPALLPTPSAGHASPALAGASERQKKHRGLLFSPSLFRVLHPTSLACNSVQFSARSLFFLPSFIIS